MPHIRRLIPGGQITAGVSFSTRQLDGGNRVSDGRQTTNRVIDWNIPVGMTFTF
jgi:hypothetical protein